MMKVAVIFFLLFSVHTYAGFYSNTAHSRANCAGFNESITWNWSEYHWWEVISNHECNDDRDCYTHVIKYFMSYTWRAAAFHMQEDPGMYGDNWYVHGYHFYMNQKGQKIYDVYTWATNCNIYDGWWEKNKAKGE